MVCGDIENGLTHPAPSGGPKKKDKKGEEGSGGWEDEGFLQEKKIQ